METSIKAYCQMKVKCTDPTYKEWKQKVIDTKTLPSDRTDPTYKEWKLEIPENNGAFKVRSTDPTYKEWKLNTAANTVPSPARRTDPTYKEWKLILETASCSKATCTDPTYKEWKLYSLNRSKNVNLSHGSYLQGMETRFRVAAASSEQTARILPTRNGNYSKLILGFLQFVARILPTRNGNNTVAAIMGAVRAPHGSYLQGMETVYDIEVSGSFLFLKHGSYLQGMETVSITLQHKRPIRTDPTYKEWKRLTAGPWPSPSSFMSTDPTYKEWKPGL